MLARTLLLVLALALAPALASAQAPEGRLLKIKNAKLVTIAYRTDAIPFSFEDDKKQPTGYTIDLCRRVVASLEQQLGVQPIQIKWVPVTTQTRFDAIAKGQADMECGSTTVTLSRMKQADFSSFTFVDSTGLLVKTASGAKGLADLSGKKIGVVTGTTNEKAVNQALKGQMVNATVVPLSNRDEGLAQLEGGQIDAFASDKVLLIGVATKAKDAKSLAMLDDDLSFEPYAIMLPRGDAALRLAVNTAIAQMFKGNAIIDVYSRWFGMFGKPGPLLQATYLFGGIPE